ncbi:MAG: YkgJ family cysteine cluster protein [Parachlamydiaceae bacterium]
MSEPLKVLSNEKPWYSEGLRFKCTECGQCCTGGPGYAWVTKEEIETIASHLGMTVKDFGKRYLRSVYGRYSLVEKKETYDCIFLKDKKCQIYQVRPTQCRTFPWWAENLKSPEAWKEAAKHCEGISCDAPVVPFEEIQPQLERDVTGEGL